MDWAVGIVGAILAFSCIVLVHELGHYVLAKWHGVRVEVFSLGFGPYLLSVTLGETVYVLSLIPLGGYVKMTGQSDLPTEVRKGGDARDYSAKRPGQRAAILAAGTAFNIIFAFVVFALVYKIGLEVDAPIVGEAPEGSALAAAGIRPGDRILYVNGRPVKSFLEARIAVAGAGGEVILDIERKVGDRLVRIDAVKVATAHDSRLGARTIGLAPFREEVEWRLGFRCARSVRIWLARDDALRRAGLNESPAARAGLRDGDAIIAVEGRPISSPGELVAAVSGSGGKPIRITFFRDGEERTVEATPAICSVDGRELAPRLMVQAFQADQVVEVDAGSEAYAAGLRVGAYLMSVRLLRDRKSVELEWAEDLARDGSGLPSPARTKKAVVPARLSDGSGLSYRTEMIKAETIELPLVDALSYAWADVRYFAADVFRIIACLLKQEVELKNVSGPLGIADLFTRVSREKDIAMYLWFVAFISLNVGVLQMLPIPILDGGHLAFLAVEKIKGSPLNPRVQVAAQYVGLFIIASLFILATRNDIMKWFSP